MQRQLPRSRFYTPQLTIVSNLVKIIPSIPLALPLAPAPLEAEDVKSRRDLSNLDSWSTASFPTRASPTKMTLSGLFTATSWEEGQTGRRKKARKTYLCKSPHQWFIVLHSASRVHENNVVRILLGCKKCQQESGADVKNTYHTR